MNLLGAIFAVPNFARLVIKKSYNEIINLVAHVLQVPMAAVALLENETLKLVSQTGFADSEIKLDQSFCKLTLRSNKIVQITDFSKEDALRKIIPKVFNPQVVFYLGVALRDASGKAYGTFFIMDKVARTLTDQQTLVFSLFTQLVANIFTGSNLGDVDTIDEKEDPLLSIEDIKLKIRHTAHEVNNQAAIVNGGIYSLINTFNDGQSIDAKVFKQKSEKIQVAIEKIVNTVKTLRSEVVS